jgi:DNA-directed RNA polymerase specialized sigma24 family protein
MHRKTIADVGWRELLMSYRSEDHQAAAAEVLQRLGSAIEWLARRQRGSAVADSDDMRQELSLAVLEHALTMRVPEADRWIPRMLVERAIRSARRTMGRLEQLDLVALDDSIPAPSASVCGVPDLPPGSALTADPDARLLFRRHVLGIPPRQLAEEIGSCPEDIVRRLARARRRLRSAGLPNTVNAQPTRNARTTHAPSVMFRGRPPQLRRVDAGVRPGGRPDCSTQPVRNPSATSREQ